MRYRVLRDLLDRPTGDPEVAAARREIGRAGWAAQILAEQLPDGQWASPGSSARELYRPKYIATNWRLLVLSDLGMSRRHPGVARAVRLFVDRFSGPEEDLYGSGAEVCFTGNAVRMLHQFGFVDEPALVPSIDWLVRHQKTDGGWHCFRSRTGTLDGWEAMAAFAAIPRPRRSAAVQRSIERGAEFFLERGLLSEDGVRYAPWLRLHYPVHYYYDFLVGLDFLTALGYGDDRRLRPALDLLERRRQPDGTWTMDAWHPDSEDPRYPIRTPVYPFGLELPGRPSRWLTTTAMLVLRRAGR